MGPTTVVLPYIESTNGCLSLWWHKHKCQLTTATAVRGMCADDVVGCLLYALVLHRHLSEAIKGVTVHTAAYGDRMIVCSPACEAHDTMARLQRSLSQIGIGIAEDSLRCYCSPHAGWSTRDMIPGNFVPKGLGLD